MGGEICKTPFLPHMSVKINTNKINHFTIVILIWFAWKYSTRTVKYVPYWTFDEMCLWIARDKAILCHIDQLTF